MEADNIQVQVCRTSSSQLSETCNTENDVNLISRNDNEKFSEQYNSMTTEVLQNLQQNEEEGENNKRINEEEYHQQEKLHEHEHEHEQLQEISNRENVDLSSSLPLLHNEKSSSNRLRTNSSSSSSIINNNENNNKFQFRTPQQFLNHHKKTSSSSSSWKKSWKKQSKSRQKNNQQHQYQHHHQQNPHYHHQNHDNSNIVSGTENCLQNAKNHKNHHYHHNHNHHQNRKSQQQQQLQQQPKNNCKQQQQSHNNESNKKIIFKRMTQSQSIAGAFSSIRSKFFLPQKRPRKEIIIPPTKFLLGGNISDPLNLNSLQDETSNSMTPNATPKQSPITTPPKVEVIIPPNIHDPLHLLDPVDSTEYEKQLVSPMKRKSKSKHRHRKKRPKYSSGSNQSCNDSGGGGDGGDSGEITSTTTATTETTFIFPIISPNTSLASSNVTGGEDCSIDHEKTGDKSVDTSLSDADNSLKSKHENESNYSTPIKNNEKIEQTTAGGGNVSSTKKDNEETPGNKREKACRDLRLNLTLANIHQQLHSANGNSGSGNGRKRKNSEGPNSNKNKSRRLDSMDKIVSPVVPQPGAWKRPPRTAPSGGRKNSRVRSISASENDLLSPTEETKTIESEGTHGDTPDIENTKQIGDILSSSTISSSQHLQNENDQQHQQSQKQDQQQQDHHHQQQSKEQQQNQEQQFPSSSTITSSSSSATPTTATEATTTATTDGNVPKKFKPDGAKYQYGNYDNYPEYRSCNLTEFLDIRLQVFKRHPELFRGKDILDIGCNAGHMTIAVAQKFSPKSILGIDIDSKLISKARKNLSLCVRIPKVIEENGKQHGKDDRKESNKNGSGNGGGGGKKKKKSLPPSILKRKMINFSKSKYEINRNEFFPISFPICYGPMPNLNLLYNQLSNTTGGTSTEKNGNGNGNDSNNKNEVSSTTTTPITASTKSKQYKNEFPNNVFFRVTNYVLPDEALLNNDTQQYDLILCLSVTKWIHLNFGDAGLKLAFKRMFNQLRPGGKLILEAQNWASYKKKKNLTETIYNNCKNIEFFPDDFHEYLLSNEVGFSHAYTLDVPRHKSKGFSRPIQLYAKGDFTPSHIRWSDNYHPQITPYEAYRGIYAAVPRAPHPPWNYDTTPQNNGNYSCRQTPMYQPTSQYYNPLETDAYLPSYDTEILNRHYVFASPLYHTVWSPPASLRNSSSHTPLFGSVRDCDDDVTNGGSGNGSNNSIKHVYPPNDDGNSPSMNNCGGAFNSIREVDPNDENFINNNTRRHVYASLGGVGGGGSGALLSSSSSLSLSNYENNSSLSPHPNPNIVNDQEQNNQNQNFDQQQLVVSSNEIIDSNSTTMGPSSDQQSPNSNHNHQHHHHHHHHQHHHHHHSNNDSSN